MLRKNTMPDLDIFNRVFASGWVHVARKINNGVQPNFAAYSAAQALKKDIRSLGGFPDLRMLYKLLPRSEDEINPEVSHKVFETIRNFERDSNDRDKARILAKAYLQTYIEIADRLSKDKKGKNINSFFPSIEQFAKRICRKFLDYRFHSRLDFFENSKQDNGYWHVHKFRHEYNLHLENYIDKIAVTLTKDPNFTRPPRFKRVKQERKSMKEQLYEPILLP